MLYMPAKIVSNCEIRLPVFAADLIDLFSLFPEHVEFESTMIRLFRSSPGLLLYAAIHYQQNNSRPVEDFDSLVDWVRQSMFETAIESDAFEIAEFDNGHLSHLLAWQDKPSRKRLGKYLDHVSIIGHKQSKQMVREWFSDLVDFSALMAAVINGGIASSHGVVEKLPVRSMWLSCAKMQQLQTGFEENLNAKKMAAMKQIAYGASHEINNPLANVATRAQSLLAEETHPAKRQKLAVIYAQAMRAHEMISDMMLFAHPPELNVESTDVVEIVDGIAKELRSSFKTNQIKFSIRKYPGACVSEIDVTQIGVALKAIIENSVCAIGSNGEVRVQIWSDDKRGLGLAVVDDGPGIDASIQDKLFDPFYSGREAGRGLGFGLSKAWRIVEMHGGTLEIDSSYQSGARLVMRLPLRQQNAQKKMSRIDNVRAA